MQTDELSDVEYTRSLLNLGRMLEKHHQSKIVILIDEYDTPIQQGHSRNFYNEVITFMRNFMSGGLKDNPSLAFGVLTGILRVSKENLFSGLNNPIVNSVLDEKYSKYFGFTVDEVNTMAADRRQNWKNFVSGTMDIVSEVQKSIIPGLLPIISIITARRNHIGPILVIMRLSGRS